MRRTAHVPRWTWYALIVLSLVPIVVGAAPFILELVKSEGYQPGDTPPTYTLSCAGGESDYVSLPDTERVVLKIVPRDGCHTPWVKRAKLRKPFWLYPDREYGYQWRYADDTLSPWLLGNPFKLDDQDRVDNWKLISGVRFRSVGGSPVTVVVTRRSPY